MPEGADFRIAMTLGEAFAVAPDYERHVAKARGLVSESAVNEDLLRGGRQQVIAANYFGHAHKRVIDSYCQGIAGTVFIAGEGEIADCAKDVPAIYAGKGIIKFDCFVIFDFEAPDGGTLRCGEGKRGHLPCCEGVAAFAAVIKLFAIMRSGLCILDIAP